MNYNKKEHLAIIRKEIKDILLELESCSLERMLELIPTLRCKLDEHPDGLDKEPW